MLRVVKVGGSLLDWPELPTALRRWLHRQPPAMHVLICGGGKLADYIRLADQRFRLGAEPAHWLAVDCMSVTARLLADACVFDRALDRFDDLLAWRAANTLETIVFDTREFLRQFEATLAGSALSRDWSVTSDSIAARLAVVIRANELVLLKSTSPPSHSLVDLAASGYVDRHFPVAAAGLAALQFVNLREDARI